VQPHVVGRSPAEHHVELGVAEDERVVAVQQRDADRLLKRVGEPGRQLQAGEARAEDQDVFLHRASTLSGCSGTANYVVPHSGRAGFEDGTVDYLGVPAIEIGLRHIERIGIDTIARRVEALGGWLLTRLQRLEHSDGGPVIRVYGPATWDRRGGHDRVQLPAPGRPRGRRAPGRPRRGRAQHLPPTGCFCNPGAGEVAFAISRERLTERSEEAMILDDYIGLVGDADGRRGVRVSLGIATNFADVFRFMAFATGFADLADVPTDLPPRLACWRPEIPAHTRNRGVPGSSPRFGHHCPGEARAADREPRGLSIGADRRASSQSLGRARCVRGASAPPGPPLREPPCIGTAGAL
jgi:hypothetical protein